MSLGYFGNIWVRQNDLNSVGATTKGHMHAFDHVSMLTTGTVKVTVDGCEPTVFSAPTFIIIRKEHAHTFEAVTPKVTWFCVFALRDFEGEVIEDLYGREHDPMSYSAVDEDYWTKVQQLEKLTTHEVSE